VQSSTIVYEIEPGGHLGWHTDATEETQYIISGTGELRMEDGTHAVGPGSVFALKWSQRLCRRPRRQPAPYRHRNPPSPKTFMGSTPPRLYARRGGRQRLPKGNAEPACARKLLGLDNP
jgi:Cupin domain